MPITQRNPVDDARPEFCAGRKVTETHKALLWQLLNGDPNCPSRMVLHTIAETQVQISVTLRQINRLRKAWGLNRGKGRPRRAESQKKI
jgi:transposase